MIIDIDSKYIKIRESANLRMSDKSQLRFWGYANDNLTEFSAELSEQLFLKTINYFRKEQISFDLSSNGQIFLEELDNKNLGFTYLKEIASDFKSGKFNKIDFEEFKGFVFKNIKRSLKAHQLKAAYHLYLIKNGANFSVPGSGKTSVILTVYEKLRMEGKVNTLFVIGPPSCFGPWRNEFIETLGRSPATAVLAGGNKTSRKNNYYKYGKSQLELYLTTFQSALYDQNEINFFLARHDIKAYVVIDEAHYIKQINGNWASSILKHSKYAVFKSVLTGTPMPKSYADIYNLFDFLWPDHNPISSSQRILIKYNEDRDNRHSVKSILKESIGPLFYRVRKSELNLQPQIFTDPIEIKMGKYERIVYDAIYKKIRDFSKKDYFKNEAFLNRVASGRIIRLRQCLSYTKLLSTVVTNYDESLIKGDIDLPSIIANYDSLELPSKLIYLLEQLRKFQERKEKVVVWANFIETIKLIERFLTINGIYCKKIYGDTPIEGSAVKDEQTREKIRDEFVDATSGLDVLIANPAACSESISLHKTCHTAIYYDLSYNCAQYLQSLDRIHRVGASELNSATYHFLQYEDTIDADIKNNIDLKTQKMLEVIEEDYPIYSLNMFEEDGDIEAYKRIFKRKK